MTINDALLTGGLLGAAIGIFIGYLLKLRNKNHKTDQLESQIIKLRAQRDEADADAQHWENVATISQKKLDSLVEATSIRLPAIAGIILDRSGLLRDDEDELECYPPEKCGSHTLKYAAILPHGIASKLQAASEVFCKTRSPIASARWTDLIAEFNSYLDRHDSVVNEIRSRIEEIDEFAEGASSEIDDIVDGLAELNQTLQNRLNLRGSSDPA